MSQTVSNSNCDEHRREVIALLNEIKDGKLAGNGYSSDKQAIANLFARTNEEVKEDILLRLTVIDSMYSTQMSKRYYGLENLAEAMYALRTEKGRPLKDLFMQFAKSQEFALFNYQDENNLFAGVYGIGKDAKEKGVAISLISKYAYFCTDYNFPIFDTIVCETLPSLCKYLGLPKPKSLKVKDKNKNGNSSRTKGDKTMVSFVNAINTFFKELDTVNSTSCTFNENLSTPVLYDNLDRLLWFVGKIRLGNLSLVLSKSEYKDSVEYCNEVLHILCSTSRRLNYRVLAFVKPELVPFFRMAKTLDSTVKKSKNDAYSSIEDQKKLYKIRSMGHFTG